MHFTIIAIGFLATVGLAAPLNELINATLSELDVDLQERATLPGYCFLDKIDKTQQYSWNDLSQRCNDAGWGAHCCGTFIWAGSGNCPSWKDNKKDVQDLQLALHGQIAKDGMFKTTTEGKWTCGFDQFTSAIAKRGVEMEWFKMILNAQDSPVNGGRVSTVHFNNAAETVSCRHLC